MGPFEFYAWQRDESGMTRVFCYPQDEGQRCGILWIECPDAVVWKAGGGSENGLCGRKKLDKGDKRMEERE